MRTSEIRKKAHWLRGTLHSDRIGDQLLMQREANTSRLAYLIISRLSVEDLIAAGGLIARGWVAPTFAELMLMVPRQEADGMWKPRIILCWGSHGLFHQSDDSNPLRYCDFPSTRTSKRCKS